MENAALTTCCFPERISDTDHTRLGSIVAGGKLGESERMSKE
jgi:hypothetical protein